MNALLRTPSVVLVALLALLVAGTGLFFLAWSGVVLSKLFADYQDSPPSTYLLVGLVLLGIAGVMFAGASVLIAVAVRIGLGHRRLR